MEVFLYFIRKISPVFCWNKGQKNPIKIWLVKYSVSYDKNRRLFIQGRWLNSSFVNQCHLNLWPIENSKYSETCLNWTLQKLEFCINCIKNMSQYYILGNLCEFNLNKPNTCLFWTQKVGPKQVLFRQVSP
jgi:hypothetical protein